MDTSQQSLFADPKWTSLWKMMKENSLQLKETKRRLKETEKIVHETTLQMKETDRQMKETDKKIKNLSDTFSNKWGKLVEAITRPAVLTLFKKEGIKVSQIFEGPRSGIWENHE